MKKLNKVNYNRTESIDAFASCSFGDCYSTNPCNCGSGWLSWLTEYSVYSDVCDTYFWSPKQLHTK